MSTDWGYRCLTCNIDSPRWLTNGEHALSQAHQYWPEIKAAIALRAKLPMWDIEINPIQYQRVEEGELFIVGFLEFHEGHYLVLLNEYGKTQSLPYDPNRSAI